MRNINALRQQAVEEAGKLDAIFKAGEADGGKGWTEELSAQFEAQNAVCAGIQASVTRMEAHNAAMRLGAGAKVDVQNDEKKFATFAEQLRAVYAADTQGADRRMDERLIGMSSEGKILGAATGLNESLGPDGGFMLQKDFIGPMMQVVWDNSQILSRIRTVELGANSTGIVMNGVDERDRANGSRQGGIYAYWLAEAGLTTASRPKFKKLTMNLEKLAVLAYATDELLQDSTALASWLDGAARNEFNFRLEDAIINGSGAGMPEGVLFSDALIQVTADAGTTAAIGITPIDIANMYAVMPPSSLGNAAWFISPDLHVKLLFLAQIFKNGSDGIAALPGQITYTPPGTGGNRYGSLLGLPVIPTEYNAVTGTVGDIILADMSQYLGITKGDVDAQSSIHVRFLYGETAFRFMYRFNGKSTWTSAIKPKNGNIYRSPFVVLGART